MTTSRATTSIFDEGAVLFNEGKNARTMTKWRMLGTATDAEPFTTTPWLGWVCKPYIEMIAMDPRDLAEIGGVIECSKLIDMIIGPLAQRSYASYPNVDLAALERLYDFTDRINVADFIEKHQSIFGALIEIRKKIDQYFGPSSKARLELLIDPESFEEPELGAFIKTSLPPDRAFDILKNFDHEWWLDEPGCIRERLCIDLDFE